MKKLLSKTLLNSTHIARIIYIGHVKDVIFISLGVVLASIGLKGFLLPNNFMDGGAMGVSLLLKFFSQFDLSLIIILVNAPFILLGARQISYAFAIKSTLAIIALSILVHFISFPPITSDKSLISIFGGFFLGAGMGFTIRGGAVLDGSEVLAINVSRKSPLTIGDFISIFNIILFSLAATLVNVETAMYSILTYLSASKTVDFIIHGVEEYLGVMIMSRKADEVKNEIINHLGRGVTVLKAEGGYGSTGNFTADSKVLFCVVTRLEVTKLLLEVQKIDPEAFVVQHSIKDTKGGMIKKRPLH